MSALQRKLRQLLDAGRISQRHAEAMAPLCEIEDQNARPTEINQLRAEAFLASSPGNRNQPPSHVAHMANQMKLGLFHDNQMMSVNNKGELRDGHGRCMAVIASGSKFVTQLR